MKARKNIQPNVIWIELENHQDDDKNKEVCEKANKMLDALGIHRSRFGWMRVGKDRKSYVFHDTWSGTYSEMVEDGQLLNLDAILENLEALKE